MKSKNNMTIIAKSFAVLLSVLFLLSVAGCSKKKEETKLSEDMGIPATEILSLLRDQIPQYVGNYYDFTIEEEKHSVYRVVDHGTAYIVDYLDIYIEIMDKEFNRYRMRSSDIAMREEDSETWKWSDTYFGGPFPIEKEQEVQEIQDPQQTDVTQESDPMDAPESEPKIFVLRNSEPVLSSKDLRQGEIVTFGSYWQNKEGENKEPIEWYVVETNEDSVLLVSVYILDCKQYNSENKKMKYKDSDLYKWLNDTFKNEAFTEQEQSIIQYVTLPDKNDNIYLRKKKNNTATKYAVENGLNTTNIYWWICIDHKDPDKYSYDVIENNALCGRIEGKDYSFPMKDKDKGVRPAVFINY